ncbi:MAG TPA: hypothetical protein VGJ17_09960, partial [Candidatus Limnocylindrales bacterium]
IHRADRDDDRDESGADVSRLRTAHDLLDQLADLDVPEVLAWHDEGRRATLVLTFVPIRRRPSLPDLAGAARILAAAHERGLVHGRFSADSVCIDPDGRVVVDGWVGGGAPAEDVAALGAVLEAVLAMIPTRERRRSRRHGDLTGLAARATAADATLRPGMVALADGLDPPPSPSGPADGAPTVHADRDLPRPTFAAPVAPRRPDRPRSALLAGSVLALGLVGLSSLLPARSAESSVLPDGPRVTIAGVAWAVGGPGDHAAVGDWDCDGRLSPALLRADGSIWVWDQPDVTPRAGGTAPAARSIDGAKGPDGCDRIVVRDAGGREVPVSRSEDRVASPPRSPAGDPGG